MNNTTFLNNLHGGTIALDGNMLSTLLNELINCDGKTFIDLPEFRIKELLNLSARKLNIGSELKLNESLTAIYCLCFYYSFTTQYNFNNLIEFISLSQSLLCETLIMIQKLGPNRLIMSNFTEIFQRNENIETEYLLEPFTECLTIAQTIGRALLIRLRYILRNVGVKTVQKTTPKGQNNKDPKAPNETDIDCYAPHCLYFMCCFSLSTIAANLKSTQNLNFIPGMLEMIVIMLLTKSAHSDSRSLQHAIHFQPGSTANTTTRITNSAGNNTATATVTTGQTKPMSATTDTKIGSRENSGQPGTATTAINTSINTKPMTANSQVINKQIQFNLCVNTINKLAVFMAHLLFDERTLQEVRLVRGRLVRSLTHNDCIVAQFHTSNVKLAFTSIVPSKMSTTNIKDKTGNRTTSPSRRLSTSPGSPTITRKNAITDIRSHALSAMAAWSEATSNKMNVNSEGFYFFNEALLPISEDYIQNPMNFQNNANNTDYDPSIASKSHRLNTASNVDQWDAQSNMSGTTELNQPSGFVGITPMMSRDPADLQPDHSLSRRQSSGVHHTGNGGVSSRRQSAVHSARESLAIRDGTSSNMGSARGARGGVIKDSASIASTDSAGDDDFDHDIHSMSTLTTQHKKLPHNLSGVKHNRMVNSGRRGAKADHGYVVGLAVVEETPPMYSSRSGPGDSSSRRSSKSSLTNFNPNLIHVDTQQGGDRHTPGNSRRTSRADPSLPNSGTNNNNNRGDMSGTNAANNEQQKLNKFWQPTCKPYRQLFLLLENLPNKNRVTPQKADFVTDKTRVVPIKSLFSADYVPAKCKSIVVPKVIGDLLDLEGISLHPVTETVRFIESQYYTLSDMHYTPRFLNPSQEIYWICTYAVEYIHKQTLSGAGFHPSIEDELKHLQQRVKTIKKSNEQINALSVSLPSLGFKELKHKEKHDHHPQINHKKEKLKPLTLADKLNQAVKEATAESKLYEMERKIRAKNNPEPIPTYNFQEVLQNVSKPTTAVDPKMMFKKQATFNFQELNDMLSVSMEKEEQRGKEEKEAKLAALAASGEVVVRPSAVWHCKPKVHFVRKQDFEGVDLEAQKLKDNPLLNLPTKEMNKEYTAKIAREKKEAEEKEEKFKLFMEDQTEAIIADTRTAKAQTLKNLRQKIKEDIQNKLDFKAHWEEERKAQAQQDKQDSKRAEKEKRDAEFRERMRISEIKMIRNMEQGQAALKLANELTIEKQKIKDMADKKEAKEIIRRAMEEARMKYLEERRRVIDKKLDEEYAKIKAAQDAKSNQTLDVRDAIQGRVRMGNFVWHNGVYGFYDNVRAEPIGWVQYEDASGKPYYYDPHNNITQYRKPADAPIRHYTEDERKEYDAQYGEGAYDAWKADMLFKDGVNRDGGYWNEQGEWELVNGYYDENYQFVQYEGYYDDNGKYIKYAKASGNLNFMV